MATGGTHPFRSPLHLAKTKNFMIKALVSDFSRVILSPVDKNYAGGLNLLHKELSAKGDYDFWKFFQLNQNLLAFYKTIGEQIDVFVFTSEYIQEHPALQPKMEGIFKGVFSAARLGLKKTDVETYKIIADKIDLKPEEILYIDDKQANINAAKEAGLTVIHYESNKQAEDDIQKAVKNFSFRKGS